MNKIASLLSVGGLFDISNTFPYQQNEEEMEINRFGFVRVHFINLHEFQMPTADFSAAT